MIYVGIVSYNSQKDLPKCINSVLRQSFKPIRIIVYDNRSIENIQPMVRARFPGIQFVQGNTNIGFGQAHNNIIRMCNLQRGDWYLSLNPDVVLHRDYVKHIIQFAQTHKTDWATGKLLLNSSSKKNRNIYSVGHAIRRDGFSMNIGYGIREDLIHIKTSEVFGASGAAALYSYACIQALIQQGDVYDPSMFMYAEDTDIDWRARLLGMNCWYISSSVGVHRGSVPSPFMSAHSVINRYLSVVKNAYMYDLLVFNIPIIISHILFRLVVTPSLGFWMLQRFIRYIPYAITHRTKPAIKRKEMNRWFYWSAHQHGALPIGFQDRLMFFFRRQCEKK